jgi:predicted TPR repeat methyltransferase
VTNSPDVKSRDINSIRFADADELAAYYDEWASSYDTDLEDLGYEAPARIAALLKAHGAASDGAVLDVSCGTGLVGRRLRDAGFMQIDGFDISEASLKEAAETGVYRRVFPQDMNEPLDAPDDAYDAVVCVGAMTYASNCDRLFREFCRVLKPGGLVAFTHRDDLWEGEFADLLARLEEEGVWRKCEITDPQPYLPAHPDFADKIRIRYAVFAAA